MLLVHVKTLDYNTYEIITDPKDTITFLKTRIHELGGPEIDKQTIIYRGTELQNSLYLEELGLPEDSKDPITMHLVIRMESIATVQCKKDNDVLLELKWDYSKENKQIIHIKRDLLFALKLPPTAMRKLELYNENGIKLENFESMSDHIKKEQRESFIFNVSV